MKPEKTAIIYARVSTVRQAEEELPIEGQLEQCHKKAQDLGATVLHIYRDDGKSGRYDTRPAFQRAITYCLTQSPDYFITWSSSRFARNIEDAMVYKRKLSKAGVNLIYVCMDVDTETIGGFALDTVMSLFDDIYSRQLAADTVRGMMKNARDGYYNGGSLPFGFESHPAPDNPKRKKLKINPTEAPIAAEIFKLKLQGHGLREIAITLNEAGKLYRGRRWKKGSVSSVLHSHAVIGQTCFNKENKQNRKKNPPAEWVVVKSHEPIVSIENWNAVQEIMRAQTFPHDEGAHNSTWVFTGLIHCDKCGALMQIETAKGRSKRYNYYNCMTNQKTGGCETRRIPAGQLEDWLVDQIAAEVFTRDNLMSVYTELQKIGSEWAGKQRAKRKELLARHTSIENKNRNLFDIMERLGSDTPNLGDLTRRLRTNNAEIAGIEAALIALDNEKSPELVIDGEGIDRLAMALVDIIRTANNPENIRSFYRSFINGIFITDKDVLIKYMPEALLKQQRFPASPGWLPRRDLLGTVELKLMLPERLCNRAA